MRLENKEVDLRCSETEALIQAKAGSIYLECQINLFKTSKSSHSKYCEQKPRFLSNWSPLRPLWLALIPDFFCLSSKVYIYIYAIGVFDCRKKSGERRMSSNRVGAAAGIRSRSADARTEAAERDATSTETSGGARADHFFFGKWFFESWENSCASKKKGWTFWYFGHCQQYVRAKGCIKSSGNDRSLFLRGSRNPEVYVRNCLNPRPMTLSSPETLRSTAFSPGDSVPGQFFHVGKCWSFEHQTRILTWHAKQMWFTEEMGACQLSMQHCNNNAWWPCAQRSGQRKHSVAWKSCSKVRLGRCMVEREYAFHIGETTQISKNYHPKICTWTCTARKCLMLFVLPLQRCIFHWFALMSWDNPSISTGSQPGSCCWWSTCQEAAGSEVAGIATQMDTDGKSTDVESILLLII